MAKEKKEMTQEMIDASFDDACCGSMLCCNDDYDNTEMYDDFDDDFMGSDNAEIGYIAPDFYLDGYYEGKQEKFTLSQYEGKWIVLFFYPLDFTFVCPTELQELSKRHKEFEKIDAQVLGISTDSVFSHQAWSEGKLGKLNYPLISDFTKETSMDYNVLHADGMALRGTFIIDPEGVLQSYTINNLNVGRNIDEILRTIKALKTGELVQCGWKEGDKTLGEA